VKKEIDRERERERERERRDRRGTGIDKSFRLSRLLSSNFAHVISQGI